LVTGPVVVDRGWFAESAPLSLRRGDILLYDMKTLAVASLPRGLGAIHRE
jgi:hypothetical protein